MNTRPRSMAAEDLTGPAVLKVQSRVNFSGKTPSVIPNNPGPPRNMGQLAPPAGAFAAERLSGAPVAAAATRNVVAARIRLAEIGGIISRSLHESRARRRNRRPREGFSIRETIEHTTVFGNLIIPIRIICRSPVRNPRSMPGAEQPGRTDRDRPRTADRFVERFHFIFRPHLTKF